MNTENNTKNTETIENYDFSSGKALLSLCTSNEIPISEAMLRREIQLGETTRDTVLKKLSRSIEIMRTSTTQPLTNPIPSMGGLIGGVVVTLAYFAVLFAR